MCGVPGRVYSTCRHVWRDHSKIAHKDLHIAKEDFHTEEPSSKLTIMDRNPMKQAF
jgi:hypothetical protein